MLSCEVGKSRIVYVDMAQSRQHSAGFMPVDVLLCWNLMLWLILATNAMLLGDLVKSLKNVGL